MLVMRTPKGGAHSLDQLISRELAVSFYHPPFAVYPLRLYGVEPGTLGGQQAAYDPHPSGALFNCSVVSIDPGTCLAAYVPAGVVPDEHPHFLAERFKLLRAPMEKLNGYPAYRAALDETQPRLLKLGNIQPVARDGLRIRVVFSNRLLSETQGLSLLREAVEGGKSHPAPPTLVQEAHNPALGVVLGHPHQSVAPPFFSHTLDLER